MPRPGRGGGPVCMRRTYQMRVPSSTLGTESIITFIPFLFLASCRTGYKNVLCFPCSTTGIEPDADDDDAELVALRLGGGGGALAPPRLGGGGGAPDPPRLGGGGALPPRLGGGGGALPPRLGGGGPLLLLAPLPTNALGLGTPPLNALGFRGPPPLNALGLGGPAPPKGLAGEADDPPMPGGRSAGPPGVAPLGKLPVFFSCGMPPARSPPVAWH